MGIQFLKNLPVDTIVYANESDLSDKFIIVEGGVLLTWEEMEKWGPLSWPHRASAETCLHPDDDGKDEKP